MFRSASQDHFVFHVLDLVFERVEEASARCAVDHLRVKREREADRVNELHTTVCAHWLHVNGADAQSLLPRKNGQTTPAAGSFTPVT